MHPDVVAIWPKTKGRGHWCTLDTCLVKVNFDVLGENRSIKRLTPHRDVPLQCCCTKCCRSYIELGSRRQGGFIVWH